MKKQNINWEERRFWASTLILAGLCANYHHNFIPSDYWATSSIHLADYLLKHLAEQTVGDTCYNNYQRESKEQ